MIEVNKVYTESCLDTMARMEDNSINCVVTSPPYYSLRKYDIPDVVWNGDKNCSHDWFIHTQNCKGGKGSKSANVGANRQDKANLRDEKVSSSFCSKCNAWKGQLGLEPTFQMYLDHLIQIFAEVKRVLTKDGTVWVNLGDSYAGSNGNGHKQTIATQNRSNASETNQNFKKDFNQIDLVEPKSLMNIPYRFAIRMTDELGFTQRNQINWYKPACVPYSGKDRFTVDFEPMFFFTKSKKYYFEQQLEEAKSEWLKRGGSIMNDTGWQNGALGEYKSTGVKVKDDSKRNKRTTWEVPFEPQKEKHYASYPTKLVEIPVIAGCPVGGIVYDPFAGTGTTMVVAHRLDRKFIGSDLGSDYGEISGDRLLPEINQFKLF